MSSNITIHHLYIFTYDKPDMKSEDEKMLSLLTFVEKNIETINDMGIKIEIHKFSQQQLVRNETLRKQLSKDQIQFPSIHTPSRRYDGFDDIIRLYQTNITQFKKFEKKIEKPAPTEAELEDYMRAAITDTSKDDDDEDSESLSGGKGINAQVSAAMAARGAKNPKPIRGVSVQREPNNVKPNKESFQQTITRLRNPQQQESGGIRGGGIVDDEPGDNESSQDDKFLRAAAGRDEDSMKAVEDM